LGKQFAVDPVELKGAALKKVVTRTPE
jgi:hypothetical protein